MVYAVRKLGLKTIDTAGTKVTGILLFCPLTADRRSELWRGEFAGGGARRPRLRDVRFPNLESQHQTLARAGLGQKRSD